MKSRKIIISGGGTGGHIFPAISIANALKDKYPDVDILFVGALGRMEMEKIPSAGYKIIGLPIAGLQRKLSLNNFLLPFKLAKSIRMAKKIIRDFKPDIVVGVGGYASGPLLKVATNMGIPALIQEQNSYAGITNRLLAKKVNKICVAYENMEKFFPKEKIIFTGNPVRKDLLNTNINKKEALEYFGLDKNRKTILSLGGSLGAGTINQSIISNLKRIAESDVQLIWQTGKYYFESSKHAYGNFYPQNINVVDFISRMDLAYKAADLVISRAGAGTISELCIVAKPVIFVPSPNVAEDHQTKNALCLVNNNAALLIADNEAVEKLVKTALELIKEDMKLADFSKNISKFAVMNSAERIADEIIDLQIVN